MISGFCKGFGVTLGVFAGFLVCERILAAIVENRTKDDEENTDNNTDTVDYGYTE